MSNDGIIRYLFTMENTKELKRKKGTSMTFADFYCFKGFRAACLGVMLLVLSSVCAWGTETVVLSSLDLSKMQQDWGSPGVNRSVDGHELSIAGRKFSQGVGTHANSLFRIDLKRGTTRFQAWVGVDDEVNDPRASVEFQVVADKKVLWRSGVMKFGQAAKKVDVDLTGKEYLLLMVLDADDGINYDHADWADARLTVTGEKPKAAAMTTTPAGPPVILTPKPGPAPRVNGPKIFGVRPGRPFLYQIPATGDRPMTFSVANLPDGLRLDARTGQITGAIQAEGTYPVTLKAENALGADTRAFKIVVGDTIALTPPLGWNSWNCWAGSIDQDKVLRAAKAMVSSGLIQHGWTYINIDDAWQGRRGGPFNGIQPNEKFPDMQGLCDEVHAMGLKIGIYSTPWTTSYAGYIGGSSDDPNGAWTRGGRRMGKISFAQNDARQWAAWGIDYLKYDWNPNELPETRQMYEALLASGRDIVLSLSNSMPFANIPDLCHWANSWRTTGDIRDTWSSMSSKGFGEDQWEPYCSPGHWNDPDMLVVGYVGWGPRLHPTQLTPDEQYTHISLWCLVSSPMLLGCDLERLDAFTLNLLTNDEVLGVSQDALGKQATCVVKNGFANIYAKPLEDGSTAVGLFNRGFEEETITALWSDIGLSGAQKVRDLWRQKDLGVFAEQFSISVSPHGVVLIKVMSEK
jgi:alpha-galactosidase